MLNHPAILALLLFMTYVYSNDRPIVGVLTVMVKDQYPGENFGTFGSVLNYDCYIPSGYVKLIEAAGARAAAIPCTGSLDDFWRVVKSVNGFLFAGMFTDYQTPDSNLTEFGLRGKLIVDYVLEQNNASNYIPLFAICKGFNMVAFFIAGNFVSWREFIDYPISATNLSRALIPNPSNPARWTTSRFYQYASMLNTENLFTNLPVTMNRHPYGISPSNFSTNKNLTDIFGDYVTHTLDANQIPFVSIIEGLVYPIYGFAFHPEKTIYEWNPQIVTPHDIDAIRANSVLSFIIANESRRNNLKFNDSTEEKNALFLYKELIVTYGVKGILEFQSCYFFNVSNSTNNDGSESPPISRTEILFLAVAAASALFVGILIGIIIGCSCKMGCEEHSTYTLVDMNEDSIQIQNVPTN